MTVAGGVGSALGAWARGGSARLKAVLSPDGPYLWLLYVPLYFLPWGWKAPTTVDMAAAAVGLPAFIAVYLAGARHRDGKALPFIAGIVLISFVLAFFHSNFSVLTVFAAAIAGGLRPARLAGWTIAAVVGALSLFSIVAGVPWPWIAMGPMFAGIVGASCAFHATIQDKNRSLERSQAEVRTLAAAAERERIARDLHDLLGHTLTVVAVKSDLAARLVERDPARSRREMEELAEIARSALTEIRIAVTGMRSTALAVELARARRALEAAEVTLTARGPSDPLPPEVEGTLAMLVREGATNVLRHARANRCDVGVEIEDGWVVLTMADDGIGGSPKVGNGLSGMRERVAALGGSLSLDGGRGMTLRARLPLHGAGGAAAVPGPPAVSNEEESQR